jgi:predicted DNA-binding protein
MTQTSTTDSVRLSKEMLDKIRYIAKSKGQTISGYINISLSKQVDRDWSKFIDKNEKKNNF